MVAGKKTCHLAQYLVHGPTYHSLSMWRHPKTVEAGYDWSRPELYQPIAQVCERGLFDTVFFADLNDKEGHMIKTQGVMHFTIAVGDVERAEQFYTEVLGLERVAKNPAVGMVFLKSGSDFVILTKSKTPIDPNPGDEFFVHHAFKVAAAEYDQAKEELEAHGVRVLHEENRTEGVFLGRQCYFHDPDRNVLELIEFRGEGQGF